MLDRVIQKTKMFQVFFCYTVLVVLYCSNVISTGGKCI